MRGSCGRKEVQQKQFCDGYKERVMALVLSPSNMMTYISCPRKFYGQSIQKLDALKWKASAQLSRGSVIHTKIQNCMQKGIQAMGSFDKDLNSSYTTDIVNWSRQQTLEGSNLFIEKELCINHSYKPSGWWDEDTLLRAKADALFLYKDKPPVIIDIKTGKRWDDDDFQVRVEALLVHLIYNQPVVKYEYWYVDIGETHDGLVDFNQGVGLVQDVIDTMMNMKNSIRDTNFPTKANKFCKWCGLHQTKECGL